MAHRPDPGRGAAVPPFVRTITWHLTDLGRAKGEAALAAELAGGRPVVEEAHADVLPLNIWIQPHEDLLATLGIEHGSDDPTEPGVVVGARPTLSGQPGALNDAGVPA